MNYSWSRPLSYTNICHSKLRRYLLACCPNPVVKSNPLNFFLSPPAILGRKFEGYWNSVSWHHFCDSQGRPNQVAICWHNSLLEIMSLYTMTYLVKRYAFWECRMTSCLRGFFYSLRRWDINIIWSWWCWCLSSLQIELHINNQAEYEALITSVNLFPTKRISGFVYQEIPSSSSNK